MRTYRIHANILQNFYQTGNHIKAGIDMKKVIIIGAGILGAATAYELTKQQVDVTIVESYTPGRATSAAAGIICPWVTKRRNQDWYRLASNGAAYYPGLIEELQANGQTDTGYRKVGALRLHEEMEKLQELKEITLKRREDAPEIGEIKLLNPQETKGLFPLLEEKFHGLFVEGGARVDGAKLRDALLQAAIDRGVKLVEGKATLQVLEQKITGVIVNGDSYAADETIAANGVWMNELFAPLELDVHFQAQKGEIMHLKVKDINTEELPVINPPNNQYIVSFDDGRIVTGATHWKAETLHPKLSVSGMQYMIEEALKMAPHLDQAEIIETRVGFRPFTYNHLPVFGHVPGYKGLLFANGLGASGLTTGPYIGKQLSQLAADQTTDIDITPYAMDN